MWVKQYHLSASGSSHLSIPLSCYNITHLLVFIVFSYSTQSIFFWYVHVPPIAVGTFMPLQFLCFPLQLPMQP